MLTFKEYVEKRRLNELFGSSGIDAGQWAYRTTVGNKNIYSDDKSAADAAYSYLDQLISPKGYFSRLAQYSDSGEHFHRVPVAKELVFSLKKILERINSQSHKAPERDSAALWAGAAAGTVVGSTVFTAEFLKDLIGLIIAIPTNRLTSFFYWSHEYDEILQSAKETSKEIIKAIGSISDLDLAKQTTTYILDEVEPYTKATRRPLN